MNRRQPLLTYQVTLAPTAQDDLDRIPTNLADAISRKINALKAGLPGSVKRLRDLDYGYRLRLGDYRVLFDVTGDQITIQRVLHRKHAYASRIGSKKRKGQH